MKLDKEDHRKFLLELMRQVNYPGNLLDLAYEVKTAIAGAQVDAEPAASRLDFDSAADARDMPSGAVSLP